MYVLGGWSQIVSDLDDPRGGGTPWTVVRLKLHEKTKLTNVLLPAVVLRSSKLCLSIESPLNLHRISIESPPMLDRISIEDPPHSQRVGSAT